MNRHRHHITVASVPIWVAALAVCLAGPSAAQTSPVVARAAEVGGRVLLTTPGTVAALAIGRGQVLNPGDLVDTRAGGRLTIELSDGSLVLVEPGTVLAIKDYRQAMSLRELFQITLGQVRVRINHFAGKPNPYRMNSPTASIAVRGTEFTVTVAEGGETQVVVFEGLVEVSSLTDPARRILIEAGRGVTVRGGQELRMFIASPSAGRDGGDHDSDRRGGGPGQAGAANQGGVPHPAGHAPAPDPRASPPDPHPAMEPRAPAAGTSPGPSQQAPRDDFSPRSAAGTFQRYIASLAQIGQSPFLLRFNAYPESHLDSLENPAYAAQFHTGEARLFVLPTFRGLSSNTENTAAFGARGSQPVTYSVSPQLSVFTPVGSSGWVVGGSATLSTLGDSTSSALAQTSSTSHFDSGSLIAARRFEHMNLGIELEHTHGWGSLSQSHMEPGTDVTHLELLRTASRIGQTRLTAGIENSLGGGHTLGVYYRHGLITASDEDQDHLAGSLALPLSATRADGHTAEAGLRLRGPLQKHWLYGVDANWLGLSLNEQMGPRDPAWSGQRDRATRETFGLGLGYLAGRHTLLSFDFAAGTSQAKQARFDAGTGTALGNASGRDRFVSGHFAIQSDLWRHLFASASLLAVGQWQRVSAAVFPDSPEHGVALYNSIMVLGTGTAGSRYSDYGVGWRFTPDLFAQYVFSTGYGASSSSHSILLRYTFRFGKEH